MDRKIKILIISYPAWREDNNMGNSYSNIFKGMDDKFEFAHIYCKDAMPQNSLCHKYFHLSEKELIKSSISRKKVGKSIYLENPMDTPDEIYSATYNKMRSMRWQIFLMARDFLSSMGKWKSIELDKFITDFAPDVIFGSLTYVPLINNLMLYVHKKFNVPIVPYPWDDFYSFKKISYSPFFWARLLIERRYIAKVAKNSEYLYTISKLMQEEYSGYFNKECRILFKGYEFANHQPEFKDVNEPLKLIYMGNIGGGRWNVLAELAKTIAKINNDGQKAELFIYTMSPRTPEMKKKLNLVGASQLMDPIPQSETMSVMKSADILVHVEPTTPSDLYFYRLSFTTKLVDYFYNAKCIIALGGETASTIYLKDHDAAIVETDESKYLDLLKELLNNKSIIDEYAKKAWICGQKNHELSNIQFMIYNDFIELLNKHNNKK